MAEALPGADSPWPAMADVYGWLGLDARGRWKLRGELISNRNLIAFIQRNYQREAGGAYVFHNGEQRVFVALEATPWIASAVCQGTDLSGFLDHCDRPLTNLRQVWISQGRLILDSERGPALLRDDDQGAVLGAFCDASGQALTEEQLDTALAEPEAQGLHLSCAGERFPVRLLEQPDLGEFFGFVARPARPRG